MKLISDEGKFLFKGFPVLDEFVVRRNFGSWNFWSEMNLR